MDAHHQDRSSGSSRPEIPDVQTYTQSQGYLPEALLVWMDWIEKLLKLVANRRSRRALSDTPPT